MGKSKAPRPYAMGQQIGERMAEQVLMKALGADGADGPDEPERPEYCGQCIYFEPDGSVPGSKGGDVCWTQATVCQMEPPQVVVVRHEVFNGVDPITRAERRACRHGIRRS